jgi:hypothetical protein
MSSAVDQGGDGGRLVGQRGEDVGGIEHARDAAAAADHEVAHAVAGHQEGGLEEEALLLHGHEVEMGDLAHRGLERAAVADGGPGEVDAGDDAGAAVLLDQQRPLLGLVHAQGCLVQGGRGRDVDRRQRAGLADAGGERAQPLRAQAAAGELLQLVRDVLEVEGGEGLVVGGELEEVLDRQAPGDRLLADDEVVPARMVEEDRRVERVAGPMQVGHRLAVALLHETLDDEIEVVRQRARAQHGGPGAQEDDVDRGLDPLHLGRAQPVEGGAREVEGFGHRGSA